MFFIIYKGAYLAFKDLYLLQVMSYINLSFLGDDDNILILCQNSVI